MAGGGGRGAAALGGNPPRHMPGAGVPAAGSGRRGLPASLWAAPGAGPAFMAALLSAEQ